MSIISFLTIEIGCLEPVEYGAEGRDKSVPDEISENSVIEDLAALYFS